MNATATTAKPEAKTEEKAINKMSREELEAKKAELNNKLDDPAFLIDFDALSKQKRQILETIQKLDAAREGEVEEISNKILQHKIKLSELSPEARQVLGAVVAQAAAPAAKKSAGKGGTKPSFQGEVLIHVPNGSRPAEYKKGQPQAQYVSGTFKKLYEDNKDNFEEALAPYIQEAGKVYFATEEGKAELARFVEFVKTKKVIPSAKKK